MSSSQIFVNFDKPTPKVIDSDQITSRIREAYIKELNEFSTVVKASIDNKIPKAKDFLPDLSNNQDKIPRPANSNIIFTNLLNRLGYLNIIKGFFDMNKINKQLLIPTSKKLSKFLWEELTDDQKVFFKDLAEEVKALHKKSYPDYRYNPRRNNNSRNTTRYIHYFGDQVPNRSVQQPENENEQVNLQPENENENEQVNLQPENENENENEQVNLQPGYWDGGEQMEGVLYHIDNPQNFGNGPLMVDNNDSVDSLPKFAENPPFAPIISFYDVNSKRRFSFNDPNITDNMDISFVEYFEQNDPF